MGTRSKTDGLDEVSLVDDAQVELKEAFLQLYINFQLLCDSYAQLQAENGRIKSVVTEVLSRADERAPTPVAVSKICDKCEATQKDLQQLRQEKEKLEFMKPYTHELLTKNEIATERIRLLEKELANEKVRCAESCQRQEQYANSVQQLAESVGTAQQQISSCEQQMQQLSQQVEEIQGKNEELELVNRHQKCIISDYQDAIAVLRTELLQSHVYGENNSM